MASAGLRASARIPGRLTCLCDEGRRSESRTVQCSVAWTRGTRSGPAGDGLRQGLADAAGPHGEDLLRYVRPGGTSESVTILDGRWSVHWSTNDPLNNGRGKSGCGVHDAFSVFVELEHAGNVKAAVRAAAQALNLVPDGPDDLDAGDEAEGAAGGRKRPKASELIVRLARLRYRLGQSHDGEPFAVRSDGPNLAIGLADLHEPLAREYRNRYGAPPAAQALAEAATVLRADAADCPREPVHLRVAEHGGGIVIDLGDPIGRAIHVTADGWQVLDRSPVLFRRTELTMAMPEPERGGSRDHLRRVLNVTAASWPTFWGYLVAAFIPSIPHPILYLSGQQGTGKTSAAEYAAGLVDPSPAPLRSVPLNAEKWHFTASGSWFVCLDNVSTLTDELQDCLCKAVTGDAFVRRRLFADDALAVDALHRVVALTSIDAGALRGDLADRLLALELEPTYVITRYRDTGANLRTQLNRYIVAAGLTPWEKPFQNLRVSRATELAEEYPSHLAAAWLGHSEKIADEILSASDRRPLRQGDDGQ